MTKLGDDRVDLTTPSTTIGMVNASRSGARRVGHGRASSASGGSSPHSSWPDSFRTTARSLCSSSCCERANRCFALLPAPRQRVKKFLRFEWKPYPLKLHPHLMCILSARTLMSTQAGKTIVKCSAGAR
jgi:hypothetical protein